MRTCIFGLTIAGMAFVAGPANGGVITYNFGGTVSSAPSIGVAELDNATSFTGTFSYEDTTARTAIPFMPPPVMYEFLTGTMTVTLDTGLTFVNTDTGTSNIQLYDDAFFSSWAFNGFGIDETIGGGPAAGVSAFQMQAQLNDGDGTAITDDTTLIGQDLSLANFPGVPDPPYLRIDGNSGGIWELRGDFTSMSISSVPEPSTGLAVSMLFAVGLLRRRQRC